MKLSNLAKTVVFAAVVLLALGCVILGNTAPPSGETPAGVLSSPGLASPTAGAQWGTEIMEAPTDPRVEATLALRSVRMELQSAFPGEPPQIYQISVDGSGNQRIEMAIPAPEEFTITPESPDANIFEIFVVSGEAYLRTGKTGSAEANPEQNDFLSRTLYSPTAPGMWLILLPEESFTPAGKESRGGFETTKYAVNGSVESGAVTGAFWVDDATGALVGAELTVSEAILRPDKNGSGGVLTIEFSVERAEVPAIVVP